VLTVEFFAVTPQNRPLAQTYIQKQWLTTRMVIRGKVVDLAESDGILAWDGGVVGLVTFAFEGRVCEITLLDSARQGVGVGTTLINLVIEQAKAKGCHTIKLITTNDNINALRFYQKRGFDMARLYRNAMDVSRKLKPEIPLIGGNGIPLKHEIEFEMTLDCVHSSGGI